MKKIEFSEQAKKDIDDILKKGESLDAVINMVNAIREDPSVGEPIFFQYNPDVVSLLKKYIGKEAKIEYWDGESICGGGLLDIDVVFDDIIIELYGVVKRNYDAKYELLDVYHKEDYIVKLSSDLEIKAKGICFQLILQ